MRNSIAATARQRCHHRRLRSPPGRFRGPALKAADGAAVSGLAQVIRWNKSPAEKVEEPIARAIRDAFGNFHTAQPLWRTITLLVVVMIVVMWGDKAFGMLGPIAMCYFIYYIIWTNISKRQLREAARAAAANAPPPTARAEHRSGVRRCSYGHLAAGRGTANAAGGRDVFASRAANSLYLA